MSHYKEILYEKQRGGVLITLNRPEALNAISRSMLKEIHHALDEAEADPEIRAIVITGAGRAFSSGFDQATTSGRRRDIQWPYGIQSGMSAADLMNYWSVDDVKLIRIFEMTKPVIGAVRGWAMGGGCWLALYTHITIAAEDAKLGEIQIRHGFGTPMLITPFLLGLKRAKEVLLAGDFLSAQEAKEIGMVNRVVPADKLMQEAVALAKKIASMPAGPVQQNKLLINRSFELRGLTAGVNFSHDSAYMDIVKRRERSEEGLAHLRRLQEQGWESFKTERDAKFKET